MPHSSFNILISCIRPKWLVLSAVLLLVPSANPQPALAALTDTRHAQFAEPGQVPPGLSPADWNGVQQAYLKASNTEVEDLFGLSVAVSGKTVVVGAPEEDSGDTGVNGNQADNSAGNSGAANVFVRSGGMWSLICGLLNVRKIFKVVKVVKFVSVLGMSMLIL